MARQRHSGGAMASFADVWERPVVFECIGCGRQQLAREGCGADGPGVSPDEAKAMGWESTKNGWRCPFCAKRKASRDDLSPTAA